MKKLLTLFTALLLLGGTMMVQATDYYYRGNQNSWGASLMTPGEDGYYAYFSANGYSNNGNKNNNFKISNSTDSWDYNNGYVTRGFNETDIKNTSGDKSIGLDWDNDNICVYCTSDFYILVYFPNTTINTTNNPIVCASTTLPDNSTPPAPPTIKLHGNFLGSWANTSAFDIAEGNETASLTLNIQTKGEKEFGVRIGADDNWTSNGVTIDRDNTSKEIVSGSGNCKLNVDAKGDYTFTWTYATNTLSVLYPALPAQNVAFDGLAAQVLKGTAVNFAGYVTSSGIDNPGYRFYVKAKGGEYGDAVASYTFSAIGEYMVKVEALEDNTGDPVATDEAEIVVYAAHTFTSGTTIYVDFSAMTEGEKGVNYPQTGAAYLDWDGAGAGTIKTITFTADVTWTTFDDFIKTEKGGWDPGMKFSVPEEGQDMIIVAADGASYVWGTYVPTYYLKNNWNGCEWTWEVMTAAEGGKYRLENVVYGGSGINYNSMADDAGAQWKAYPHIKYMENAQAKVIAAFDTVNFVLDPANDTVWAEMVGKDTVVTYTVAGNSLALFDLGWAPTHPYKYTDMKKQEDGTYVWNHGGESAVLPAGNLEFKVIKSRDYANGSWPENPFVYNIAQSGEYKITIHFNPCTKNIYVDTTLVQTLNIQNLSITGSWNTWSPATGFTIGGDNDKALVTLPLTEGTYEFKLVDANNKWYGNGQAFSRANASIRDVAVVEGGDNMTIAIDKAGDYLFTYVFESKQLIVSYPAVVPAARIAPLSGKFTINANGDTAVFARGNLQYNYESDAWYVAEKQFEVLGDLNLRFGDATYTGSVDLFSWSCESSSYGIQWKYKDEDFTGAFVDWGNKFADDEKEWSTLSKDEWNFLLARQKDGHTLWTMIALGPDSLNGIALFPNDWEAPAGLTIKYGFYNLDNEEDYDANSFTFEQWEQMEAAGAVFLPLGGARAGYYGNTWSGTAESTLDNPLSSGYSWVDNENWMGYYWLSTPNSANVNQIASIILPGWHNNQWTAPTIWNRERRRGQSVRLVTRIPKQAEPEWQTVRTGLEANRHYTVCLEKNITAIDGATFWNLTYRNEGGTMAYLIEETAPEAGKPYIIQATAEELRVVYGDQSADAPVANGALRGTFVDMDADALAASGSNIYMLFSNELRPIGTNNHLDAHRAYVLYSELETVSGAPQPAPGRRVKGMPMQPQVATGIDEITNEQSQMTNKVIIDGRLFILRGEKMYDVTGREVK